MDLVTRRNLVSDVRLKRFFRNYIMDRYGEEYIWVSTIKGRHVTAAERLGDKKPEEILKSCIDARLFGATIPIPASKKKERESPERRGKGGDQKGEGEGGVKYLTSDPCSSRGATPYTR